MVDAANNTLTFDDKARAELAGKTFRVAPDAFILIDGKSVNWRPSRRSVRQLTFSGGSEHDPPHQRKGRRSFATAAAAW